MPTFEEYVELIRSQLFYMQPVQTTEAVQLDEEWLRTQYEEVSKQPTAYRANELVIAQRWEAERKARQIANSEAARA